MISTLLLLALAQAPEKCTEGVVDQAPDIPGLSVRLRAGEVAPFDARAVTLQENCERGKMVAGLRAELADARTFKWVSEPLLATLISGSALGLVLSVLTVVLLVVR